MPVYYVLLKAAVNRARILLVHIIKTVANNMMTWTENVFFFFSSQYDIKFLSFFIFSTFDRIFEGFQIYITHAQLFIKYQWSFFVKRLQN